MFPYFPSNYHRYKNTRFFIMQEKGGYLFWVASSFIINLTIRKTTSAMMIKSIMAPIKSPTANFTGPQLKNLSLPVPTRDEDSNNWHDDVIDSSSHHFCRRCTYNKRYSKTNNLVFHQEIHKFLDHSLFFFHHVLFLISEIEYFAISDKKRSI